MGLRRVSAVMAVVAALVIAGTAAAGGWATATLDSGAPPELRAGEALTIGFTVKQHGRTPIGWEQASLLAFHPDTGEALYARARPQGPTGHYVVEITFPSEGTWEWRIETANLVMETRFPPLTVRAPSAGPVPRPAVDGVKGQAAQRMPGPADLPLVGAIFLLGAASGAAVTLASRSAIRRLVTAPTGTAVR